MSNTIRNCATCAAFREDSIAAPSYCLNLVSFIISPGRSREPGRTDVCDSHQTHQEDAERTADIEASRQAIMGAIKATVATQTLLDKLRNGGSH